MNLYQAMTYGEDLLKKAAIDQPLWNAERLLLHALHLDRAIAYADLSRELTPEEQQSFEHLLQKRVEHYPLAYIEGTQEFFGRTFFVNESVLIPRPETEEIIRAVLKLPLSKAPRILDLGAGSGNIPVTLSQEISQARVFALESSAAAMDVLRRNSNHLVNIVRGDFDHPPFLSESFDAVTANPPYVELSTWHELPRETQWEPRAALVTIDLEKTYSTLIEAAERLLKRGGYLIFEVGFGQSDRIRSVCTKYSGFSLVEIRKDFRGVPRTFVLSRDRL